MYLNLANAGEETKYCGRLQLLAVLGAPSFLARGLYEVSQSGRGEVRTSFPGGITGCYLHGDIKYDKQAIPAMHTSVYRAALLKKRHSTYDSRCDLHLYQLQS